MTPQPLRLRRHLQQLQSRPRRKRGKVRSQRRRLLLPAPLLRLKLHARKTPPFPLRFELLRRLTPPWRSTEMQRSRKPWKIKTPGPKRDIGGKESRRHPPQRLRLVSPTRGKSLRTGRMKMTVKERKCCSTQDSPSTLLRVEDPQDRRRHREGHRTDPVRDRPLHHGDLLTVNAATRNNRSMRLESTL